jgi:hypothetical protein
MTTDLDIWRAATLLIEQHGENAQLVALERHAMMLVQQDLAGAEVWSRIRQAIKELQAPPQGRPH